MEDLIGPTRVPPTNSESGKMDQTDVTILAAADYLAADGWRIAPMLTPDLDGSGTDDGFDDINPLFFAGESRMYTTVAGALHLAVGRTAENDLGRIRVSPLTRTQQELLDAVWERLGNCAAISHVDAPSGRERWSAWEYTPGRTEVDVVAAMRLAVLAA